MNNHNENSHTELTLEEETRAVEFVKCTLCDESFMNELDKLKHVDINIARHSMGKESAKT